MTIAAGPTLGPDQEAGRAGREQVRLRYEAPSTCPPRDVVIATIAAELGYDPVESVAPGSPIDEAGAREVWLRIVVDERGHYGTLTLGDSERAFSSESCTSVVASAAVAAAIIIDPAVGFAGSLRKPIEPLPAAAPVPWRGEEDPPSSTNAATDPPSKARDVEMSVYAAPYVDLGVAPGLGGGGLLGASARLGPVAVGLEGRAGVPRAVQVKDTAFVDVFVAGAAGLLCAVGGTTTVRPLRWAVCGEGLFVDYVVTGRGLRDARTDHALVVAAGPRLAVDWSPWPPLTVGGFFDLLAVPLGVRVRDDEGRALFSSAPIQAAAGLSAGAVF